MWEQGEFIAFSNGTYYSVPDWESRDLAFPDSFIFYNTKGDLRGDSPEALQDLLPADALPVPESTVLNDLVVAEPAIFIQ